MAERWFHAHRLTYMHPNLTAFIDNILAVPPAPRSIDRYGCAVAMIAFAIASDEEFINDQATLSIPHVPGLRSISLDKYYQNVRVQLDMQNRSVKNNDTHVPPLLKSLNHYFMSINKENDEEAAQEYTNIEEVILGIVSYFSEPALDEEQISRRLQLDCTRFITISYREEELVRMIEHYRDQTGAHTLARLSAMACTSKAAVRLLSTVAGVRVIAASSEPFPSYESYSLPDTPYVGPADLYDLTDVW